MTFEEWWEKADIFDSSITSAEEAWEARVPEGYCVVPIEPTEAVYNELEKHQWHGADSRTLYKVMIQASQESE